MPRNWVINQVKINTQDNQIEFAENWIAIQIRFFGSSEFFKYRIKLFFPLNLIQICHNVDLHYRGEDNFPTDGDEIQANFSHVWFMDISTLKKHINLMARMKLYKKLKLSHYFQYFKKNLRRSHLWAEDSCL